MRKGSVLVVEDNDLERQTLTVLLRRENYDVFSAANGISALDFVDQKIDVVLSDLRMHGANGIDLLRLWKARRPSTPFIFVTGVVDVAQVVEAVKLGAEDYISKPFRTTDLLDRVAECVDAARDGSPDYSYVMDSPLEVDDDSDLKMPANATMEEIERIAIENALRKRRGNRTHAAESLGISVRTLQRKLKSWALTDS